jgi:hypothetical protein
MKPMVKYHLPFSTIEETEFRVFSMYALAQYLKQRKNLNPDWEFKDLKKLYGNIRAINRNVAKKIVNLDVSDTSVNAVVILNNFADSVTFDLDDDDLTHLEDLFKDWLT